MFSERRDKTCLRNEFKLTYHYILSYIYNTSIVRHNKRIIYFKNIYKTDLREHTYTVNGLINGRGGLYPGGLISGWAYIRNTIFAGKWMGLYPGGLKTGGGALCSAPLSLLYSQPIQL